MFHTQRDVATFSAEMLLFVAAGVGAVYAAAVLIALVVSAFRSRPALYTSFALSTIVSIPLPLVLTLQWPYLPGEWDINPITGVFSLLDCMLLCFVWAAPILQYRLVRQKSRAPAHKAANQSLNPTGNRPAS
jgi:hypothetical protein